MFHFPHCVDFALAASGCFASAWARASLVLLSSSPTNCAANLSASVGSFLGHADWLQPPLPQAAAHSLGAVGTARGPRAALLQRWGTLGNATSCHKPRVRSKSLPGPRALAHAPRKHAGHRCGGASRGHRRGGAPRPALRRPIGRRRRAPGCRRCHCGCSRPQAQQLLLLQQLGFSAASSLMLAAA